MLIDLFLKGQRKVAPGQTTFASQTLAKTNQKEKRGVLRSNTPGASGQC